MIRKIKKSKVVRVKSNSDNKKKTTKFIKKN